MNIKSILLGTAAALASVPAAFAADLPSEPTPEAVDYVKVCDVFSGGFFYIPGTETCLDISGRVRAKLTITEATSTYAVDGRVQFDARTATEYGTLRSFFELGSKDDKSVSIGKAYLQLGYVTVGYAADLLDGFGGVPGENGYNQGGSTDLGLSVTYDEIGGGFYVGAGLYLAGTGLTSTESLDDFELQVVAGIADQPWGKAAVGVSYDLGSEVLLAKAAAEFKVTDELTAGASIAYQDATTDELFLAAGASYKVTDSVAPYAAVQYLVEAETFNVNLGVETTITSGLSLTTDLEYAEATDALTGFVRLNRSW